MLRRILIILGYTCLTLLVLVVTFVLVAYGNDYVYDFATHQVIHEGHVIIQSTPSGVVVDESGRSLNKKTPYQAAFTVGPHVFSLSRDGYWTWQKTLNVVAGEVTLAQYVILMPKHPATTTLDSKSSIADETISSDQHHLAYITGGANPAVYTLDLGSDKVTKVYTPKAADPTAGTGPETLTGVAWSQDASQLLVSSTIDGNPTFWMVPAGGGSPTNLTDQYGFDFAGLEFSTNNANQLYWINNGGLRRLDIGAQTVSDVLADNVSQFWPIAGGRVVYVQQTDLGRSLWSIDSSGHKQELIPALPDSSTYAVAYASYNNQDELAVVPAATQTGTLYSGIFSDTSEAKTIAHGVTGVSFSPDGHLVAFTGPNTIQTYDLQAALFDGTFVRYDITDQPGTLSSLSWFDSYHILVTRGNELYWSDYDGTNRIDMGKVASGLAAYGITTPSPTSFVELKAVNSGVKITQLQVRS